MMEVTGHLLEWLGLLVSSDSDKPKRSMVSLDISINSPFCIHLTSLLGTGGSPAPNDKATGMLILRFGLLEVVVVGKLRLLASVCLPVCDSHPDIASVAIGI